MAFTVEQWKAAARQRYMEMAAWLKRQERPAGLFAYGSLTAMTLWPLVEQVNQAAQAGQPLPMAAILALGGIAGGVGGNLLASQIQNWHEAGRSGNAPDEEEVLAWLAASAADNDEIRQALDALLLALEAIPGAREVLPPEDWQPYFAQLFAELQAIGNLPRYEATLLAEGLIVQGDNNEVRLVTFNQQGQTVQGWQANFGSVRDVGHIGDQHNYYGGSPADQVDRGALREAYLSYVLAEHNRLLLGGIDPKAVTAEQERLRLSAVYTALLTETREGERLPVEAALRAEGQKESRQLSALELLNKQRHLVLLGDPGSGKSTFVNFAAVCFCGQALGDAAHNLALLTAPLPLEEDRRRDEKEKPAPQPWEHGALLPVCITLREFAARGLPKGGQKATADHLWRFLDKELQAAGLEGALPLLRKELLEKGGIFMFDGLDEVPSGDAQRLQIKQVVEDIAATCRKSRVLVTSRTYAYQKQDWRLPDFTETVLAPFCRAQIAYFVDRWYEQMAAVKRFSKEDAAGRAVLLKEAIFGSRRLYDLAERPLLLTLMASLHAWRGGSLPEKREELYADAVELLLDVWEQQRIVRDASGKAEVVQPSLEQWLKVDRDRVRGLLNRLAYEGHLSQPDEVGTADIPEEALVIGLLHLSEDKSLQPGRLIEFLSNRAGLLLPRGQNIYTFPHRTFQEYLAACHLTAFEYPARVAELARRSPNRWREVALLAGAKAGRGSSYALWGLVEELCLEDPGAGGAEAFWGAHLAGQLINESADLRELSAAQTRHLERVRQWLVHVLQEPVLPARERALAGRHLAQLGDPRPEVMDVDAMQFCLVPGGDFWLGEGDEAGQVSFLDYDYWLARYPVTVAQYHAFVEDDGYANPQWWAEAITAGRWKDGGFKDYWSEEYRAAQRNWGPVYSVENQPAVGLSWYEALAFCRWQTARWRATGLLPETWQVTLPSEVEWEKGARGGLEIPASPLVRSIAEVDLGVTDVKRANNPDPQRTYTWPGDELTTELANYDESEINRPSAVGCYRQAAAVYGGEELLGNVWEWTRSLHQKYPYDPEDGRERLARQDRDWTVVRGGSYYVEKGRLRCGARGRNLPNYDIGDLGFRLVLSPLASGR